MIRLTIDDREITVPEGTMVVDAAQELGIDVPIYCYHQALGPLGACRICLVQVEKMPKLVTACTTAVQEGMVVHTRGSAVDKGRQGVLEFLLINHPLDCPVCDKGGECFLQDYTFQYGSAAGRYDEPKIHKLKDAAINEFIIIDQERCVLCQRCVRFMGEYVGEEQLLLEGRGVETVVSTVSHQPMDSQFSGNVIDLCPVGALLSIPYRYKARPWNLERAESVCPHCPVACTTSVTSREGHVIRVEGRPIPGHDWGWLCDRGRFGYDFGYVEDRLLNAWLDGEITSAAESTRTIGSWLNDTLEQHGGDSVAFLVGGQQTMEEAYQIRRFADEVVGTSKVAVSRSVKGYLPLGLNGTFEDLDRADTIVYLGQDPYDAVPVVHLKVRDRYRDNPGLKVIGIGAYDLTRSTVPGDAFVLEPGEEAAFLAYTLAKVAASNPIIARLGEELGDFSPTFKGAKSEQEVETLGRQLLESEHLVLLWDGKDPHMESVLLALRGLREDVTAVLPTFGPANWRGFERAGIAVDYDRLEAFVEEAIQGKIHLLFSIGADLLRDYPDRERAKAALAAIDRVVSVGLFFPEQRELYHAVIPGAGWSEVDGTYTNMEGRMQVAKATVQPPGQSRPVRTYLGSWAHALKKSFVLEPEWDPFDHNAGDLIAKEALPEVQSVPKPARPAMKDGALRLVGTALVMEGGMPSEILQPRIPKYPGRISLADASRLGIGEPGGELGLRGQQGMISVMVAVDERIPQGVLVLPYGVVGSPLNQLGDGAVVEAVSLEEVSLR